MKQLKVKYPERAPDKAEMGHGIEVVLVATLNMFLFDGKEWFPYTAKEEIYKMKNDLSWKNAEVMKPIAERNIWHWLGNTLQEGKVEVDGKPVEIYGVAAAPIVEVLCGPVSGK